MEYHKAMKEKIQRCQKRTSANYLGVGKKGISILGMKFSPNNAPAKNTVLILIKPPLALLGTCCESSLGLLR